MVFIKTKWDDVVLNVYVDTRRATLSSLKQEIGKKWIIQTTLQKLYFGVSDGLEYEEIVGNPSLQLRDDLCECGNQLSLSQLGVEPWSTLLLVGPVFRPPSFFDSDDAVVFHKSGDTVYVTISCGKRKRIMMEQECESLMRNNVKQKMD